MKVLNYQSSNYTDFDKKSVFENDFNYIYLTNTYVEYCSSNSVCEKRFSNYFEFLLDELCSLIISSSEKSVSAIVIDIQGDINEFILIFKNHRKIKTIQGVLFLWTTSHLSFSDMLILVNSDLAHEFIDDPKDRFSINSKVYFLNKFLFESKRANLILSRQITYNIKNKKTFYLSKRGFDILLSLSLLILLIPLFLLVSLAIFIESGWPVFYVSKRVGKWYKIFPMLKFRSMKKNAEKDLDEVSKMNKYAVNDHNPHFIKIIDDPRVTSVGRFLRKTSIDELPQLINVLMGHMSIVGNRPLPLYEAEKLMINEYVERFDAPAGITGLWQVKKKNLPNMSERERINIDIEYSRRHNLLSDLIILLKTPRALIQEQHY